MKLTLAAVGRLRPAYRAIADEYVERLVRYGTFREIEVKEAARSAAPEVQMRDEAARLRDKLPAEARIVALDRGGRSLSSDALARHLDAWRIGAKPVGLAIGGSHGLDPALVRGADLSWSLGMLTLPHELARVVVLEQLYRAWTILHGEPYHK